MLLTGPSICCSILSLETVSSPCLFSVPYIKATFEQHAYVPSAAQVLLFPQADRRGRTVSFLPPLSLSLKGHNDNKDIFFLFKNKRRLISFNEDVLCARIYKSHYSLQLNS